MSYPAGEPVTITELLQARYDAVRAALFNYRQAMAMHPRNPLRTERLRSQQYWTAKAYLYHGEILARRDPPCFY